MIRSIFIPVAAVLLAGQTEAGSFASSSDEMLRQLTTPTEVQPQAIKTRGLKTRGIKTRGLPTASSNGGALKSRGLERVKTDAGSVQINQLPETQASVNLKVEFDVASYAIRANSLTLLDELGKTLKRPELSGAKFIVGGHTDSDGSNESNVELSFNRARAIRGYLVNNHNIDPNRLKVVGYGETTPISSNADAYGKQKNRRVEVLKLQ